MFLRATRHSPLATLLILLCLAAPAFAGTLEQGSQNELQDTLDRIKASQAHAGQLKEQSGRLERDLSLTQEDSAHMAAEVQKQEGMLTAHEEKIAILEAQRREKLASLQARRMELSRALSAMIRFSGAPKEAVIAQPGSLERTLQTAEALGVMTQALRKEADSLKEQITEIDALKKQITDRYRQADERRKALAREQKKLEGKIAQGRHLRDKLYRDEERESETIVQLSKKSQSLQELLSTLENARRTRNQGGPAHHTPAPVIESGEAASPIFRLPAEGRILQRFGNHNVSSASSRGLLIATREGAQIVAPGAGEIVFTGPFMDYGRMVIIRHEEGLHTLLAGFERIDVTPGDRVEPGEPIGRMGAKNTGNRLYLELRKDGHPVDPAPWFK